MSNQIQTILNDDAKKIAEIKARIAEAENTSRIVLNTLNLLCSETLTIPSGWAKTVYESQSFLDAFHKGLQGQMAQMKAMLPAEANAAVAEVPASETPAAAKAIELEVK